MAKKTTPKKPTVKAKTNRKTGKMTVGGTSVKRMTTIKKAPKKKVTMQELAVKGSRDAAKNVAKKGRATVSVSAFEKMKKYKKPVQLKIKPAPKTGAAQKNAMKKTKTKKY